MKKLKETEEQKGEWVKEAERCNGKEKVRSN
jgi:hypothetical protein